MDRLVLAADVRDAIVAHAQEGAARSPPEEVCGILSGDRDAATGACDVADGTRDAGTDEADRAERAQAGGTDLVTASHRVPNVADTPRTRYELDPVVALDTIESLEAAGADVVGFYHSHPDGPAEPSATDRAQATWTDYVYLIVSLAGGEPVDAWRWTGDGFADLAVRIEELDE